MDYETKLKAKHHSNIETGNKKIKYLRGLITRSLLAIIVVLAVVIFSKMKISNKEIINKYLLDDTLKFTSINNYFHGLFGNVVPEVKVNEELVFSSNDMKNYDYEKVKDYYQVKVGKGSTISSLCGGIVVFSGEKEGFGNTLIVQGNDGVDIWYGNITDSNVNLYDYIEKDTILGVSNEELLNLKLVKDGKSYEYEKYLS